MCCSIKTFGREVCGQATVEAAFLLPLLLFLVALLMQPICIFYTRATMAHTASEATRLISTKQAGSDMAYYKRYITRRLEAVPEIDIFHKGGRDGWDISVSGGESDKEAQVEICTKVAPLPLLGILALPFVGESGAIELEVSETTQAKPSWLGGDYATWIDAWQNHP